ncbi:MAG TPA: hypothetical protein PKH21_04145 [Candidatus Cloacimonadota bacterium]|nr:hypothetical protein [Candidatus Cloacimonadota bacterium]
MKKIGYGFVLAGLALLLLNACEINKLNSAQDHFDNKRYAAAIQELDAYIGKAKNGALITRSEILRGKCYHELGLMARQRENWDLAVKFLKLSNSEEADQALADVYKTLCLKALEQNKQRLALDYVNAALREIPDSPLTPEMLSRRIGFTLDVYVDHDQAWEDYKMLYDRYPNNSYELVARKQIMRIVPNKVEYARQLYSTGYYNEGLVLLFELGRYPVVNTEVNNRMISEAYLGQAESFLETQDYMEADRFFRIAMQYDPAIEAQVSRRLEDVASLYIKRGDELLARKEFDQALAFYRKSFDIIPNYTAAEKAIARLNTIKANIIRAEELNQQAEKAELGGKYSEAQSLYRQAYNLDAKAEYRNKAAQMQNMIEATNNPTEFARRIINEYRGGLLNQRIQQQKGVLLRTNNRNEIRDSGWKFLISSGQFKYEARYDLITPTETFFYVWQVNLRDRIITPLNKISENLMR